MQATIARIGTLLPFGHPIFYHLREIHRIFELLHVTRQALLRTMRGTPQWWSHQRNLSNIFDRIIARIRTMLTTADRHFFQSREFKNTLRSEIPQDATLVEHIINGEQAIQRRSEVQMLPLLHRNITEDIGRNIASYL